MRRLAPIALLALLAVLATACGGRSAEPRQQRASQREGTLAAKAVRCAPGLRSLVTPRLAWAAVVRAHATAYRAPGRRPFAEFGKVNANAYPTVLGVRGKLVRRDCSSRWLKVALPMKPNGVTGWVRAADVDLAAVRTRIVVDVSARRVTLFRSGRRVLSARAAVGAAATPTPLGSYYVNQRLIPEDESGPFGPGAIGISAFSEVLTGWAQGGPVAIHGTNAPWLIGQAVSNGCIRVANDDLRRLFAAALAGTPVQIRA